MTDAHDGLLSLHVAAGSLALLVGPLAMWVETRPPHLSRSGLTYHWLTLAVSLSAVGLAALDWSSLWWLSPFAVLAYFLALLGVLAPRRRWRGWIRAHAHGQGGSYIALLTALIVVSLDGTNSPVPWVAPTLAGLPLIEWRVARVRHFRDAAVRKATAATAAPPTARRAGESGKSTIER